MIPISLDKGVFDNQSPITIAHKDQVPLLLLECTLVTAVLKYAVFDPNLLLPIDAWCW